MWSTTTLKERDSHVVIGMARARFSTRIVVKKGERRGKGEERWQDGCSFSEELLRVAYVTAISFIPRFIFLAPCYIPPILRPPVPRRTTISSIPRSLLRRGKGYREECRHAVPPPLRSRPSKISRGISFSYSLGSDSPTYNLTNF